MGKSYVWWKEIHVCAIRYAYDKEYMDAVCFVLDRV